MNVFEHAMKMEEDGRAYYLKHAENASLPALKKIMLEMADDELKHYNMFKSMRDSGKAEYEAAKATTIIATTKNIFEQLKSGQGDAPLPSDTVSVWEHARQIEQDSEAFYRARADELDDEAQKVVWHKIADEEHRHYVALDNVIQFINKPARWLEDAEWSNLTE